MNNKSGAKQELHQLRMSYCQAISEKSSFTQNPEVGEAVDSYRKVCILINLFTLH